jgi:hypothetical protein
MNWNTLNTIRQLFGALASLRETVSGCRFDEQPEAFKDIEGCKARIEWLRSRA